VPTIARPAPGRHGRSPTLSRTPATTPRRATRRAERIAERRADRDRARRGPRPAWRAPIGFVTIAGLVVGALILAVVVLVPRGSSSTTGIVEPSTVIPADLQDGTALGRADAPVTVDEYVDFQCPYCGQLVRTLQPRIVSDFVATGKVRLVAHDLAFLGQARTPDESTDAAVAAACAARQGKYWPYRDYLFANQLATENSGAFSRDRLEAIAEAVGLDRSAFDRCFDDPAIRAQVAADTNAAFGKGINQTPTLYFNGKAYVGVPTYDQFAALVAQAAGPASPAPSPAASSAPSSRPAP
jgi:protein-disulfide isomerase